MAKKLNYGFFVSVIASAVILNAFPLSDTKFALYKLGPAVQSDLYLKEKVAENCGSLVSKSASPVEKLVLERVPVPSRPEPGPECTLVAAATKATRLHLRSHWYVQIQVRNPQGVPIAERKFAFDFPRPLVLLPLVMFLLALVFEFRHWGIGATVVTYLFFLCGANLIGVFHAVGKSLKTAFEGNQSWTGLWLILFWVALCRGRRLKKKIIPRTLTPDQSRFNRAILAGVGLWNPAAFTLAGRLLVPFHGLVSRVNPFFTVQTVAICLSVYLLSVDYENPRAFLSDSLLLPRYFTFSVLIFLFLQYRKQRREPLAWSMPGSLRTVLLIAAFEASAAFSGFWYGTTTLTRMGLALVLGQLLWPFQMAWKRVAVDTFKWSTALLLAASISVMSHQLSVTDLALLMFDPKMHPTGVVFFTFLSGLGLGFATGNFAVAFFAIFMTLTKSATVPLVKAALLDGILAGMLISPFSVLNLIPAAQFGLSMTSVVAYRFKQLASPLIIGLLIYAVSAINSVAILRPATFVFLCLVAMVIHLKKSSWRLGSYTISPDLRSDAR